MEVEKKPLETDEVLWLLKNPERIRLEQVRSQFKGDVHRWLELGKLNRFLKRNRVEPCLTNAS